MGKKEEAIEAAKRQKWPGLTDVFQESEICWLASWDKDAGMYNVKPYPYVHGRLRLLHEDHRDGESQITISTSYTKIDDESVILSATLVTKAGTFQGMKRGKMEDLEKLETGAVGRALFFAGYGIAAPSAEEMKDYLDKSRDVPTDQKPAPVFPKKTPASQPARRQGDDASGRKKVFAISKDMSLCTASVRIAGGIMLNGAPDPVDLSIDMTGHWAEFAEFMADVANLKTGSDIYVHLQVAYPHLLDDFIAALINLGAEIAAPDDLPQYFMEMDIERARDSFWAALQSVMEQQPPTDYQSDVITDMVAATKWVSLDSAEFRQWLNVVVEDNQIRNQWSSNRVIDKLRAGFAKKNEKVKLPDRNDYAINGSRIQEEEGADNGTDL